MIHAPAIDLETIGAVVGGVLVGEGSVRITDVTHDSAAAGSGVLFACRPGRRADGHDFAPAAVEQGSPALLVERRLDLDVPQLVVDDVAGVLGDVAAAVHGHPTTELLLLGVTGTNGKTTSAYLLESVLRHAGHRTGLVGTVATLVDGAAVEGVRTTPESTDLQRLFRGMRDRDVTAAAMEVSSHGLALGRVNGCRFAAVSFTNLTQDHLDFHTDLEDYFGAKASLFDPRYSDRAAVNLDDGFGRRLAGMARDRGLDVLGYSTEGRAEAEAVADDVVTGADGSEFRVRVRGTQLHLRPRLPGLFNVANALGVACTALLAGVDPAAIESGIGALAGVPGRMERVAAGQPFTVLVDYAHTPDSVARVLATAREFTSGRLIVVLGCGGDRDRGKRPGMGHAAAAGADLAIFTSDNPRSEDPDAIIADMRAGLPPQFDERVRVEADRRKAIGLALGAATAGDAVVIAGKGHEATQEFADRIVPFDDRVVAAEWLGGGA